MSLKIAMTGNVPRPEVYAMECHQLNEIKWLFIFTKHSANDCQRQNITEYVHNDSLNQF